MNDRYLKVDTATGYVVNITIGPTRSEGFEAVQQTAELLHVVPGWSYVDGQFSDTRAAYRAHVAAIGDFGTQGFLASIPEA